MTREQLLAPELSAAVRAHALAQYPRESIGVIVAQGEGLTYQEHENVAADPLRHGQIDAGVMTELHSSGTLRAVVHSHPDGPDCPSAADMRTQIEHQLPFIIVSTDGHGCLQPFAWGDELEPPPLLGRGFRHGVTDCYSCCRDYYRLGHGLTLPDFPRDWEWWLKDKNLYMNGLREAGFVFIDESEARPGDAVLMRIRSPVPNHAGVISGPGLLLHHVTATEPSDPSRLSRREPLGRWRQHITHWLRSEALAS